MGPRIGVDPTIGKDLRLRHGCACKPLSGCPVALLVLSALTEWDTMVKMVLIVGSGPDAPDCLGWDLADFAAVVAINNAWRVRPDWTHLIHPEDFPPDRRPDRALPGQSVVTARDYVPSQNRFGGVVYAGGTMAFTAGYWALDALKPDVLAFIGCDMVYPATGPTHFYGTGAADPLRADVTLQDLEAKSARLMLMAAASGCRCVNLSRAAQSRLVFPRATPQALTALPPAVSPAELPDYQQATAREAVLAVYVPSGRYWEVEGLDRHALAALDQLWRAAYQAYARPAGQAA